MDKVKYIKVNVADRLPEECWKDVVGYEDLYQVSNLGNVKSKYREVVGKDGRLLTFKSKMLKRNLSSSGYYTICIKVRALGLNKSVLVHRLVAQAFIPNPDNFPIINHIDLNKYNNNINNLEWCSHSENVKHAIRHGLIVKNSFDYSNCKLNQEQLLEIRELLKDPNHVVKDIAAQFNVTYMIISKIKNNRTYQRI